ncbi:hypothetical protein SCHPADRAFT_999915 [Schizopora paradoxa]|uniref:F-box domain-containing protein n=1 Tax=Schizopora paradoxa TaxID=27342 RepID=A0A0H2RDP6_9AGAM|nr:hypothetical protein SCHPADRAFT_999915 [Schizopora paradoxa]
MVQISLSRMNGFPAELLERIYLDSEPRDFVALSSCCRQYHDVLHESSDQFVWRTHFLERFDDPKICINRLGEPVAQNAKSFNWKGEFQRRIRAQSVLEDPSRCRLDEVAVILRTLISMIIETPLVNAPFETSDISKNLLWFESQRSSWQEVNNFISYLRKQDLPPCDEQLLSQFYAMNGLLDEELEFDEISTHRSKVYRTIDLHEKCRWGPYCPVSTAAELEDESSSKVDWTYIRAVENVFAFHLVTFEEGDEENELICLSEFNLSLCQAQVPEGSNSHSGDWAGVEGNWEYNYCHLPSSSTAFQGPEEEDDWRTREVLCQMSTSLKITNFAPNPLFPSRPSIFFADEEGFHNFKGSVSMTPEKEVRWKLEYMYMSQELPWQVGTSWSFDGVQVGVLKSTFGVLGTWSNTLQPANHVSGPAWFHKVRN